MDRNDKFNWVKDRDGRNGQEWHYVLDNRYDPAEEKLIYGKRRDATAPIVQAWGSDNTVKGSGLQPLNNFRAVTEPISNRLTDIPQLTYPESLYVLDRSLDGYEHLYHKAGPFQVNSDMIGFTP